MKFFKLLLILSYFSGNAHGNLPPLQTAKDLDLDSYMGKWHQVALIPNWFQRKCVADTTAQYSKEDDGKVRVVNSCLKKDGKAQTADGSARVNPKYNDTSRLQVTFAQVFGIWFWIFGGDYWVMELGENYEYAVVGEPKREYLWILSRVKSMSSDLLTELEGKIAAQGYDTCAVKLTQDGAQKDEGLCSYKKES